MAQIMAPSRNRQARSAQSTSESFALGEGKFMGLNFGFPSNIAQPP